MIQSGLLRSIGVPHAFTTRRGGCSAGVFDSLNFGNPSDLPDADRDPVANIMANWRSTLDQIGLVERTLIEVHQVHGAAVDVVRRPPAAGERTPMPKADAVVTDCPGLALAVRVADCTPVLLASEDGRVVASVHAGWRGVIDGVVMQAVRAMSDLGVPPTSLYGAIGPCIGRDQFEVGPEVAAEFQRVFGENTPHARPHPESAGKFLVDLKAALAEQFRVMAVGRGRIEILPHCTASDPGLFFSHRRDRGRTGRMAGIIGPRG